jgi:membrane glycosyltransferase
MLRIQRKFIESCFLILMLVTLFLLSSLSATAQELTNSQRTNDDITRKGDRPGMKQPRTATIISTPVYKDFMGVTLGMSADEVRAKLGHLKNKGERQDFFVFSDSQSAQIVYDDQGKVIVISADYVGKDGNAPSPESVLGEAVQAKHDGSIYQIKRYPAAGYWVAYSRTAGDNPIVTVTMQKM